MIIGNSPRRRVVLIVAAALVVVLAVAALVLVRRGAEVTHTSVAQDRPGPVLLVPGYGGDRAGLEVLATVLRAAGRDATVLALPGDGTGPLAASATALDVAARAAVAAGAPSVDVVGYSAGGVIARLWVAEQGGAALARRVVTLGSPHHGTEVAGLAVALAPSSCPAACQELAPDSDLLAGLNRGDETPDGPRWISIWTIQDETVTPPDSARLDGALDLVVQNRCPGRSVSHGQLPRDAAVQALVLAAVGTALPNAAGAGAGCPAA